MTTNTQTPYFLDNPFTPSMIASQPDQFFGRYQELRKLERAFSQGSICIQGSVGIGKSSLLSRILLLMEGFESNHRSKTVLVTAHADISNIDEAAQMILERFVEADEKSESLRINLFKVVQYESKEAFKNFTEGRHLAVLTKLLEKDFLGSQFGDREYLIIAIDESDKCPLQIAKLIRVISNNLQQTGMNNVRFVLAGIYPYFKEMTDADQGVSRLFSRPLHLQNMPEEEAVELLDSKFKQIQDQALDNGQELNMGHEIASNIVKLSGGHPHLLQLLGYHLLENEVDDPDNVLDLRDLTNALRSICYEDRVDYYDRMLHQLDVNGKLRQFSRLIERASSTFPTNIPRELLEESFDPETIQWLYNNNFIARTSSDAYGLVDEFLRVRITMDEHSATMDDVEKEMLSPRRFKDLDFEQDVFKEEYSGSFEPDDYERDEYYRREDIDEEDDDADPYRPYLDR